MSSGTLNPTMPPYTHKPFVTLNGYKLWYKLPAMRFFRKQMFKDKARIVSDRAHTQPPALQRWLRDVMNASQSTMKTTRKQLVSIS